MQHIKIGGEFGRICVGRGHTHGMARRFQVIQHLRRSGQPRIHAGNGAAVGLVFAMLAVVG